MRAQWDRSQGWEIYTHLSGPNSAQIIPVGISTGFHQDLYFSKIPLIATEIWDSSLQADFSQSPQVTSHSHHGAKTPLQGRHGCWGNHLQLGLKSPSPPANFGHPKSLSPDIPHFKDLDVCLAFLYPAAELCAGHETIMPYPETNICCRHLFTSRNLSFPFTPA